MERKRQIAATAVVGLAAGLVGVPGHAHGDPTDVYVFDNAYSVNLPPGPIEDPEIEVGDTIRWLWVFGLHDVVASAGQAESFQSPLQSSGFFEHTFTNAGTFAYFCSIHGVDDGQGGFIGMGAYVHVTEPCIADWLGNGEVDINDFFAFLDDFAAGDPRADLTGSGEVDINDFFLYLQEFEAGC